MTNSVHAEHNVLHAHTDITRGKPGQQKKLKSDKSEGVHDLQGDHESRQGKR